MKKITKLIVCGLVVMGTLLLLFLLQPERPHADPTEITKEISTESFAETTLPEYPEDHFLEMEIDEVDGSDSSGLTNMTERIPKPTQSHPKQTEPAASDNGHIGLVDDRSENMGEVDWD